MRIMRGVAFVFVVLVVTWAFITGINSFSPFMLLLVGAVLLIAGLLDLKLKRKINAIISFTATAIVLSASTYIILT
ncbi:hypothetical protein DVB69_15605 [Sporosarcina sp. BI001-red]|uniref:hypothetical protein n=1 Tax=Sporosarcina sp. BI001-red TaxID=2282866 RepID=UPI000E23AABA|nr:hypothetical protein [Sporosarcina sp. BI001-red]REB05189.1 hypothetical protein DVB69_15605 [Sporosarcina sp. BI001-red]